MGVDESVEVQVVYALPDRQMIYSLRVPAGTTIVDAVRASGVLDAFPSIELAAARLGIYGHKVAPDRSVRPGDRIEIYRPLEADPKVVRRERAGPKRKSTAR